MAQQRLIPRQVAEALYLTLQQRQLPYTYDHERHRITLHSTEGEDLLHFRLPLTLPPPGSNLQQVQYVLLLIQAGNCAMGYFEDGRNLDHKVYRSYMVRKKQGKSQVKYLKTKGKSRAGSRVRLGETEEFFENINGRLQNYFSAHTVHRIAISCSKTLLPYLYGSRIETPFAKDDPRILKIPKHIHTPVYEVMLDANRYLQRGELAYPEDQEALVQELLGEAG